MDARLSPEQQALRESAAQIVDRLGVHAVAHLDDAERRAKLDAAVAGAGWLELRDESDAGGPWASAVETAIVTEELARGLADVRFMGAMLAGELRRAAGAPPGARTETVLLDAALGGLVSTAGADGWASGIAVDAAGCTSALLISSSTRGGILGSIALAHDCTAVDLTRPSARPAADAVGRPVADAPRTITSDGLARWTAFGLALTCADLVGSMRGATLLATDYAKSRMQYGAAIGSFQAVQHLLADAIVATEGSRSVALHAAWAADALPAADALAAAAVAKAYCARAARMVCETAIQVHGGIGNTWDCLAHVYLRRALVSIDMFGGVGPNLARVLMYHGIGDDDGLR